MKHVFVNVLSVAIGMVWLIVPGQAEAEQCEFLFATGDWDVESNWSCTHVPGAADEAWIPLGRTCSVPDNYLDAVADFITVDGTLNVNTASRLTITSNSTITGGHVDLVGTLIIGGNLTITGDDADIDMTKASIIDDNGTAYTLTLKNAHPCSADPCFVVHGAGFIKVRLVNNVIVSADRFGLQQQLLHLQGSTKSGGNVGIWKAEAGGGLSVEAEVTGSAKWEILDGVVSRIHIQACCRELTGDVELRNGKLQVDAPFCTTGDLIFVSEDLPGPDTTPEIAVGANEEARFGGTCVLCSFQLP